MVAGYVKNNTADVYLYDRNANAIQLVSHALGSLSAGGNSRSFEVQMSSDGHYVVMSTQATDLPGGTYQGGRNVVLYDRVADSYIIASHATGQPTASANSASFAPRFSADGQYLVYQSLATNLVLGSDSNNTYDIFLYSVQSGANTLVSHTYAGANTAASGGSSFEPAVSNGGQTVVYYSQAADLVPMNLPADSGSYKIVQG